MPSLPYARLGTYELIASIGAGGMGEVFAAQDPKLGRKVALKILPDRLAADPVALARFEREARALAALSHPAILSIFEFGREGQVVYAVMELLEGRTLREAMKDGPMAPRRVAELGEQIARGLAVAHGKGIVHRDLKPENLFLTRDGLKILDFGLARTDGNLAQDPETRGLESNLTGEGMLLGTVGYMSPEQVRGEPADARSDLFSLGVVLYEMLAGRSPFRGASGVETLNAILKEDPPEWEAGTKVPVPAGLDRVVRHCLEKDPARRFQSAQDLAFDLQTASGSGASSDRVAAAPFRRRSWAAPLALAALLAAVSLGAFWTGGRSERNAQNRIQFRQHTFQPQAIFRVAFAPDGETIIYSAALEGNVPALYLIRPEYPEPRPMGLPATHLLSISSRGELAVLMNPRYLHHRLFEGTLARVSLGGTAPREILEGVQEADWAPGGNDLAIIRKVDGRNRLEYPVGKVLHTTSGYLSDLRFSPRGDRIALFEHPAQGDDRGSVIFVDLAGKRTLAAEGYEAEQGLAWTPAGDEILFSATTTGTAFTVYGADLSGHLRTAMTNAGGLTVQDLSRAGRWLVTQDTYTMGFAAQAPGPGPERDLSWLDFSGGPALSRDARRVLFTDYSSTAGTNYQMCLRGTDGGPVVRLGDGDAMALSPDGKAAVGIIFTPPQVIVYPTGPGEIRRPPMGALAAIHQASWYPDGKRLLLVGNEAGRDLRCFVQDFAGGPPRPVTPEGLAPGLVAPDGQQLLCWSASEGAYHLLRPGGDAGRPLPGLTADDTVSRWSDDGRALQTYRMTAKGGRLERYDLATGHRTLVREVVPPDRAGILSLRYFALTEDPRAYAYSYVKLTSRIFAVEGAR